MNAVGIIRDCAIALLLYSFSWANASLYANNPSYRVPSSLSVKTTCILDGYSSNTVDPDSLIAVNYFNRAVFLFEARQDDKAMGLFQRAIDLAESKPDINWGDFISQNYSFLSAISQERGDWLSTVSYDKEAFFSALSALDKHDERVLYAFESFRIVVNLSLEASISFANAIYYDEHHPHLSLAENYAILIQWRNAIETIKDQFGTDYLLELQTYCIKNKEARRLKNNDKPLVDPVEKLSLLSQTYYTEVLLCIMSNLIGPFYTSYYRFLDNLEAASKDEDINEIRYELTNKYIARTLREKGYSDISLDVLFGYWDYLDKTGDAIHKEKICTEIGFNAWLMKNVEKLTWATILADHVYREKSEDCYNRLYNDVNDLVLQLMLLSRLRVMENAPSAIDILSFANDIVDNNIVLKNGNPVSKATKSMLYTDFASVSNDVDKTIKYLTQSIETDETWEVASWINLAEAYSHKGIIEKSDSLLLNILEYSNNNYVGERWVASMYWGLTKNALKKNSFEKAREYAKKRLATQIVDYLKSSQSLTSEGRSNYWDQYFSQVLIDASSVDLSCGGGASNAYNAALFQKSILIRQKQAIKRNILSSDDMSLKEAFETYNMEVRNLSDSVAKAESYCMFLYSMHPEFVGSFVIPQWEDVRNNLKKGTLAIEYALASDVSTLDSYYVAILLREEYTSPIIVRLCLREDLISAAVNQQTEGGFSRELYSDGELLYSLLWQPIEHYLQGVETVYYSPFGYINNINIEVAQKKASKKTVGDCFSMCRVSTTADLVHDDKSYKNASLFGDIDYNAPIQSTTNINSTSIFVSNNVYADVRGSKGGSWSYLPNTKKEIEDIQSRFIAKRIKISVYSKDLGSEDSFKSLSGSSPDIIHMATHGYYYNQAEAESLDYFGSKSTIGVRSGLVLSGGNHVWNGEPIPSGAEDGILTADEISGMDLSGTKLLTLSACQTALGDIGSDGVYGMQRSFKVAGVNTIVMSLWQVDDEACYLMMDKLYEGIVKGLSCHEAFKSAQAFIRKWAENLVKEQKREIERQYANRPDIKEKRLSELLPPEYYWAAFVMLD